MTIDVERMLRRVVSDVIGEEFPVEYSVDPRSAHVHRGEVTAPDGRTVGLRATFNWNDVTIREPLVGAMSLDDDDDEGAKSDDLRELVLVARAYLRG